MRYKYIYVWGCVSVCGLCNALVLCSAWLMPPGCQDISNPEQDEPFGENENSSCRVGLHDTVACLLSSQPGMVALEVVSTPFHIREANAGRLHLGDDSPGGKTWDDSHRLSCCVGRGR